MNIEIKVDTSGFNRMMADFPDALARAQRNALSEIGDEIKSEAQQTFRNPRMRPSPWAPRKPTYIVKVNKKTGRKTKKPDDHPLLIKSGFMWRGIDKKIVGNDTVVVGTPQEYLKYHQFGTKHMPARPVLPIDKQGNLTPRCLRKVKQKALEEFEKEFRKLGFH